MTSILTRVGSTPHAAAVNVTRLGVAQLVMLTSILRSVYLLTLAILVGSVAFFSLVVLPTLFTSLEPSKAGEIAALLFPVYYRLGLVCAAILLALVLSLAAASGPTLRRAWSIAALTTAVVLGAQAYAGLVVHPQVVALRGVESARVEFDAVHRAAVRLNTVVLAGGVGLLLASGYLLGKR